MACAAELVKEVGARAHNVASFEPCFVWSIGRWRCPGGGRVLSASGVAGFCSDCVDERPGFSLAGWLAVASVVVEQDDSRTLFRVPGRMSRRDI